MDNRRERELVLAPNEYAYVLDTTKGHINCYVGPNKTSLAQTDQPVVFDTESKRFAPAVLEDAVRLFATAPANWYIALKNPARDGVHPNPGVASVAPELMVGLKHNVPGPIAFALWPGQMARVIEGHRLRADEYLYVRIYDAKAAAEAGWTALGLPADHAAEPPRFAVGAGFVIKGTDTRFYIPPTGVEVVADGDGRRVRAAVRLQRLEYCVLVGENGQRRTIRGEAIVFPGPDERFVVRGGRRKFEAIELSETTGLHVKVTAPYTEADGTARREGEELFITGSGVIYFPRDDHAIIRQDGRELHQAVAIPRGDGRYVLDRHSGEVTLKRGPAMFLPDPRHEVIIRRVLTEREHALLFPDAPTLPTPVRRAQGPTIERTRKHRSRDEDAALEVQRPAYTGPRMITLDRGDGAVRVEVRAGQAVQVVDQSGARRVEQGPTALLLGYDEMLQPLKLSTGTPKRDAERLETAYLQTAGNKVSDKLILVTRDQVRAELSLTYRVDFEGEPERWFAVEDYVKLLCDHAGSMIKARARKLDVVALQQDLTPVVRDLILGSRGEDGQRPGRGFTENGMRIFDVEVLALEVVDEEVRALLDEAQLDSMQQALALGARQAEVQRRRRLEEAERALDRALHETGALRAALAAEQAERSHGEAVLARERQLALARMEAERARLDLEGELALRDRQRAAEQADHEARLGRRQTEQALELEALAARVEGAVRAAQAFDPHVVHAINRLGDQQLAQALAENFGELAAVEGRGILETARKFLDFVPGSLMPRLAPADPPAG